MRTIRLRSFYVDDMGYEVKYYFGDRELGIFTVGELYHYFNGFMKLVVL
jgi:hypothetical protein